MGQARIKNHKVLKDAYEKEVLDSKEKENNVWCHLELTLDAAKLMLMRHGCVRDDDIGDGAKTSKLLHEISECGYVHSGDFGNTTCSTAARGLWGFRQFLHQRTRIAHKATRGRGSSNRDPLQRFDPQ